MNGVQYFATTRETTALTRDRHLYREYKKENETRTEKEKNCREGKI